VIVEDDELVPEECRNMLVVPSSRDTGPAHKSLARRIEPAADNGVDRT